MSDDNDVRRLTSEQLVREVVRRAALETYNDSKCDYCEQRADTVYGFGPSGTAVIGGCYRCVAKKHAGLLERLVPDKHE